MRGLLGAIVLVAVSFLPAAGHANETAPSVLVVVNGDTITSADLDNVLIATHQTMSAEKLKDFDYRRLLDRLVNDRLLAQEATALGMDEDPKLIATLDKRRDKQAASRWVKDHYQADVTVDPEAVRKYYEDNYAQRQCRVVVIRTAAEADSVYAALRAGADMDSLAQVRSIDSYKASGGLRKLTYYYDLEPVLRSLTDTMSVGELSAPVSYRSVYAIVRLEQDRPADEAEFDATRPKIEAWLTREESNRRWDAFVDSLRGVITVTVDSAGLAEIANDSVNLFTPEFAQGTDRVLLKTNEGQQVTDDEFRKEIGRLVMSSVGLPYQGLYQSTLSKLNEMVVLLSVTYRDGYDQLPEVKEAYQRSLDSSLVEMYVAQTVLPRITFRHDEFEAYYKEHLADFTEPDECQFDRMMIDSAQTAKTMYGLLKEGADFRYVSRQYNAKVATVEENTEWVNVSHLPDTIQKEVSALRIGECTSPHQTEDGWLILRLKARREGQPAPLDEVEPRIREVMFQRKFNAELDTVLSMLKEHSDIQYDEKAIQAYFGDDS